MQAQEIRDLFTVQGILAQRTGRDGLATDPELLAALVDWKNGGTSTSTPAAASEPASKARKAKQAAEPPEPSPDPSEDPEF